MTPAGRMPSLAAWLAAGLLALGLGTAVAETPAGGASGGAAPGQAPLQIQADSSGALVPVQPLTADGAPTSGGFAPQGGAKPAATTTPPATAGGAAPKVATKPVASGGASGGALDYQGWERMATRAESAITNQSLSNQGLENLRTELTRWREQLSGAQSANSTRIATLKDQIDALGPAPADGTTEEPEIAARRAELGNQMGRLQAPGIAAEEAYRRADGLIREIDRLLRERQASELLKLWPNPLYPPNWTDAAKALSDTALALWDETARRVNDPTAQRRMVDSLPLILPLLVFALAGLWWGRAWTRRLLAYLPGPGSARGRRIWEFLASLGPVLVPILACLALGEAFRLTTMDVPIGGHIADSLGGMGFAVMAAVWLGGRVFPQDDTPALLTLPPERRAEGRLLTTVFGVLIALAILRRAAMSEIDMTDAANSVLNLPIILAGAVVLVRIGQLMNRSEPGGDEGRAVYRARLVRLLARGVILFGIISPILAAVGYISAASALVFPSAMTLALAALLYLAQGLVGDIYAAITRGEDQDALAPVLISFGLAVPGGVPGRRDPDFADRFPVLRRLVRHRPDADAALAGGAQELRPAADLAGPGRAECHRLWAGLCRDIGLGAGRDQCDRDRPLGPGHRRRCAVGRHRFRPADHRVEFRLGHHPSDRAPGVGGRLDRGWQRAGRGQGDLGAFDPHPDLRPL